MLQVKTIVSVLAFGMGALSIEGAFAAPLDIAKAQIINHVANVEDLIQVNKNWIIGSSLSLNKTPSMGLILFNTQNEQAEKIDLSQVKVAPEPQAFPHCPGAPDFTQFNSHGLDYYSQIKTLYVVNHGGREAIEAFTVGSESDGKPSLTWKGCVLAPKNAWFDAVAGVKRGDLVISSLWDPADSQRDAKLKAAKPEGGLYSWSPQQGLEPIKASEQMSGPNGVLASRDGNTIWVAVWAGKYLAKISNVQTAPVVTKKAVNYMPDNIRWAPDGEHFFSGGQATTLTRSMQCIASSSLCPDIKQPLNLVDKNSLAIKTLLPASTFKGMSAGTSAIEANGKIWMSTYRNDRIAVLPAS